MNAHRPVLVKEVLKYLNLKPNGVYLDATFGCGGHARAILEKEPSSKVVALDWDLKSLEEYGSILKNDFPGRLRTIWGNFAVLYKIIKKEKLQLFDGILADFGASTPQLKSPGFSFFIDAPLDMRMSSAHSKETATDVIAKSSPEKLREIFWKFGEEKQAKSIVDLIVKERKRKRINTTKDLVEIILRVLPLKAGKIHPATKVFQALRIYVNKELNNIIGFLSSAVQSLKVGGSLVCISFHSLEDRLVKNFFKERANLAILTKKVVVPSKEEIISNPSSRSAKLRAAKKIG